MDQVERRRACYQHACLQYVSGSRMSNASLRRRLGIQKDSYPVASRVIRDTLKVNLIKPFDKGSTVGRSARYVPFWA